MLLSQPSACSSKPFAERRRLMARFTSPNRLGAHQQSKHVYRRGNDALTLYLCITSAAFHHH
jgi:hypothetical protein